MLIAILNIVLVILAVVLVIFLIRSATKFDWAFGDDPKREVLAYRFMRLLVALVVVGILAAIVNILSSDLV